MKATTSIDTKARFDTDGNPVPATGQAPEIHAGTAEQGHKTGKPESELRAAARRHGLTLKELAAKMGVSYGYLSSVSAGAGLVSDAAGKGCGGAGRGPGAGGRLPAGRPGEGGEQLHPGAGPGDGHEPEGPGGVGRGECRLHEPGVAGPEEHGSGVNGGGMLGHWGGVKLYHLVCSCSAKKSELTGQHKCPPPLVEGNGLLTGGSAEDRQEGLDATYSS